jgi:hypothetical protein
VKYEDTVMMLGETQALNAAGLQGASGNSPMPLLGLIEAVDASGAAVARLRITRWPVVVGRDLSADLVLSDPHVAPQHLRIEPSATGRIGVVQVLETINGVRQGRKHYQSGQFFGWPDGEDLVMGHLRLRLRLAEMPLAPEQSLTTISWRPVATTVALVLAMIALALVQAWLKVTESEKFAQVAVAVVGALLGGLALWAGLWALATKLFTGRAQFWRHVRIVGVVSLVEPLVSGLGYLLAFVFSLESLSRFNFLLSAPVVAIGIAFQLLVIAPQRRRALVTTVVVTTLVVVLAFMGTNWLQNKRWTSQLYMSALFPPSWRLAPAVPVDQWMREAGAIRQRLDERLKDQSEPRGDGDDE